MIIRLKRIAPLLLLSCLLALAGPVAAQLGGDPHTKATIVLEKTTVTAGQPVQGILHLKMDDHWHTYWKNAGDVGLPTEVAWTLPQGWTAEPLLWPAPQYLDTAGLISYAYEHEVSLPFVLKPPSDVADGPVQVKADVSWLECEEACVPGEAELTFGFSVGAASTDSPEAARVKAAFEALPKPRDDIAASKEGTTLLLHLPADLGPADAAVRFFPDSEMQISLSAPQELVKDADGSRTLKLQPEPTAEKAPEELSGVLVVGEGANSQSFEFKTKVLAGKPQSAVPAPAAGAGTVLFTLGLAFLGGIVLNLMPCVFPVLSLKVLSIVEQSRQEGSKAWHHGVVFTLGVLVSFWALSGVLLVVRAAGQEVGWGYHLQNPAMIGFLAVLFLLIGLNLFGVFEVGENLTQLTNVAQKKEGFAHSFWSGVLTTLAATPCTAPFMGSAVGFALSQSTVVALLVFTALALGVAAPYMTLTMFPALLNKLPRPGAWMITFKQILAFPMLLAVVWLVWVFGGQQGSDRMAMLLLALVVVSFAAWMYGKWGNSYVPQTRRLGGVFALLVMLGATSIGYQASRQDPAAEQWLTFSPELVAGLVAEGKPVFLDFTADWCTSCKANELLTLSRPEVSEKFKSLGVTLVKGDWTKKDPVITAALAKHGRAGVPLYVLYPGEGKEPMVLPEVLFPATVLEALDTVKKPT
jgi:thiol:disulfide interchange protein DsbD